ncbi:hypothetical protein FH972_004006 [Carpinus fangiana]|uniref:Uncharacterized protein n=1 Tax=Carpinus fangiana TaxID=176857 RepID=A0A5N6QJT0_9ROSI|nr:hypothetical protein FH972_004006 [Carpinus fangiana]
MPAPTQIGVATLGRRPTVPPPTVRCFSLRLPRRPPEKKAGFAFPPSLRRRLSLHAFRSTKVPSAAPTHMSFLNLIL